VGQYDKITSFLAPQGDQILIPQRRGQVRAGDDHCVWTHRMQQVHHLKYNFHVSVGSVDAQSAMLLNAKSLFPFNFLLFFKKKALIWIAVRHLYMEVNGANL